MSRSATLIATLALLVAHRAAAQQPARPTPPLLRLSGYIKLTGVARQNYRSDGIDTRLLTGDDDVFADPRLALDLRLRSPSGAIAGRFRLVNRHYPDAVVFGAPRGDFPHAPDEAAHAQPLLEQAYMELAPAGPRSLRVGLVPLRYALRPVGGSFLIDLPAAERFSDAHPVWAACGLRGTQRWDIFNQPLHLDLFFLRTLGSEYRESQEAVWGANLDWLVAGPREALRSLFNLIVAGFSREGRHVVTLGGGADYHLSSFWEVFGEGYAQAGDRGAEGGGRAGVRHTWFDRRSEPYLELSLSYRSAEFVSYENIDTFRILEDADHGLDVDTNYWSARLRAGLNLKPALYRDVSLELLYGYFRTASGTGKAHAQLGHEIDLRLRWKLSESWTVGTGAAVLFGSKHFEDLGAASGKRSASQLWLEAEWRF